MKYSLSARDFLKGLIMAIGVPGLTYIQQVIPTYHLPVYLQLALSALISYLIKNFFTDDIKQAQKTLLNSNLTSNSPFNKLNNKP